ncbi:MAG: DUF6125 family protein [Candidatus Thorarchaeota archaeon]
MEKQILYLDALTDQQKIDILRKNWMSHDARAQMAIVKEFGWEKGNKLNKSIIAEMGKVMMYRFINALKISEVKNLQTLHDVCLAAMEFYYPPPTMSYEFQKVSDNELLGIVKKCAVINQVKRIKMEDNYECGCFSMRSGWYKALGVDAEEKCLNCLKDGDKECRVLITVKKWKN